MLQLCSHFRLHVEHLSFHVLLLFGRDVLEDLNVTIVNLSPRLLTNDTPQMDIQKRCDVTSVRNERTCERRTKCNFQKCGVKCGGWHHYGCCWGQSVVHG